MPRTILLNDPFYGTRVEFDGNEVRIVVASPPMSQHSIQLELDDVDRLLAVREHAVDPVLDIAEFFRDVHHVHHARRAAQAFVDASGKLGDIVEGNPSY